MSQARRTRDFARGAKRVRSARRGEENASHSFRASRRMLRSPRLSPKTPAMQARIGEDEKTFALDQELKLFAFGRYVTLFMVPRQECNWNSFQASVVQKVDGRPWKQSFSLGSYSSKSRLKRERVDSTL